MPNGQPAQLANLRPPWSRGTAPRGERARRSRDIDKAIALVRKYVPQAVKLIGEVMLDESEPLAMRVKCAQIFMDAGLPKNPEALAGALVEGVEFLELRFVSPREARSPANGYAQPDRITFDPGRDIEGSETENGG